MLQKWLRASGAVNYDLALSRRLNVTKRGLGGVSGGGIGKKNIDGR